MTTRERSNRRLWLQAAGALTLAGAGLSPARAQGDIVRIMLGFPAGSSVDVIARVMAPHMSKTLGKNVIVENKPGASGTIAIRQLEQMGPESQTYSFYPTTTMMGFVLQGQEPVLEKISVLTEMYEQFSIFAINPNLPLVANVKTLKDLVDVARANPGAINYSSAGVGSISHLTTEKLCNLTGTKMQHIAYKGSQPALQDFFAGQLHLVVMDPTNLVAHLNTPRLRAIALNYPQRMPYMPDVPTTAEAGYKELASVVATVMFVGPPNLPDDQFRTMQQAVHQAIADPALNKRMQELYALPKTSTGPEARALMQRDLAFWKKVISENGIKP